MTRQEAIDKIADHRTDNMPQEALAYYFYESQREMLDDNTDDELFALCNKLS